MIHITEKGNKSYDNLLFVMPKSKQIFILLNLNLNITEKGNKKINNTYVDYDKMYVK